MPKTWKVVLVVLENIPYSSEDIIIKFVWRNISVVKVSWWSKFHVNIITASGVMQAFIQALLSTAVFP